MTKVSRQQKKALVEVDGGEKFYRKERGGAALYLIYLDVALAKCTRLYVTYEATTLQLLRESQRRL